MELNIRTFGRITEITGASVVVETGDRVGALKAALDLRFPALQEISYLVAVDREQASDETPLTSVSEVVLMPPYSGG